MRVRDADDTEAFERAHSLLKSLHRVAPVSHRDQIDEGVLTGREWLKRTQRREWLESLAKEAPARQRGHRRREARGNEVPQHQKNLDARAGMTKWANSA